jgi:hypothetical protein
MIEYTPPGRVGNVVGDCAATRNTAFPENYEPTNCSTIARCKETRTFLKKHLEPNAVLSIVRTPFCSRRVKNDGERSEFLEKSVREIRKEIRKNFRKIS